jgi:hypothetical protein
VPEGLNEDLFWSYHRSLRVAPVSDAIRFGFELGLEYLGAEYSEMVPFGCHSVTNLKQIARVRRGIHEGSAPAYDEVLYGILKRSGNLP